MDVSFSSSREPPFLSQVRTAGPAGSGAHPEVGLAVPLRESLRSGFFWFCYRASELSHSPWMLQYSTAISSLSCSLLTWATIVGTP